MGLRAVVSVDRFPQERRPLPDDRSKHQRFRTITCSAKGCGKTGEVLDQASLKNLPPEVIARKFRQQGWYVGQKARDDLCPTHARPANRRAHDLAERLKGSTVIADHGVVEGPPLREGIFSKPSPDVDKVLRSFSPAPAEPPPPPPPAEVAAPAEPEKRPHRKPEADRPTGSYVSRASANAAAHSVLRRSHGIEKPVQGEHFEVYQEGLWWYWRVRVAAIKVNPQLQPVSDPKEVAVSDASTQAVRDAEGVQLAAPVVAIRQPTREDNKRIRDELDASYDEPKQRYKGDWTDQRLAEALKVPRAWVTRIRDELYGPERNEKDDAEKQEVIRLKGILTGFEAKLAKHVEEGMALIDEAAAIRRKIEQIEGKWG